MAVSKSVKDMTFEDFCRMVFDTTKRFEKPEVLKGIRSISTTQYILGPSNACYLAELGAETIKVELPRRGEPMRHTTPFNEPFLYPLSRWMPDKGTGLGFFGANPNEYFVSLDFHKPEAIHIMKQLAAKSDTFSENYRAGTFDRWGIGARQHLQTIKTIQSRINPSLKIGGILFTMYDTRTKLANEVVQEVTEYFKEKVFRTVIPRNVKLSEAPSYGVPINLYDGECIGALSYKKLAEEVIRNV